MQLNYSKKVLEHFQNPRNVGVIKDADGIGNVGSPICGDIIRVYIKVEDNKIADIKYQTFGCAAAIASASVLTEIVKGKTVTELIKKGKTIDDAIKNFKEEIVEALDGLPGPKIHCSLLAADGLYNAIKDYMEKQEK